jgi:hypothetical protein
MVTGIIKGPTGKINVSSVDIDANTGDVSIDSASGSITMGSTLTDGQTLKLGKNGATEMIFTPHGTPGSEKIKLINTSGTDTNAIEIVSSAGSITLSASGNITLTGLPTSDPGSLNALWYNASTGALQISLGGA